MLLPHTLKILKRRLDPKFIKVYIRWIKDQKIQAGDDTLQDAVNAWYHAEKFTQWMFYRFEGKITLKNSGRYVTLQNFKIYLRLHKKFSIRRKEVHAKRKIQSELLEDAGSKMFNSNTKLQKRSRA